MHADNTRTLPFISQSNTLRELMALMDRCGLGITLVVDGGKHLEATVTDGDARRGILLGLDLEDSVKDLLSITGKSAGESRSPVVAPIGTSAEELRGLMAEHGVRQIPLLDEEERVVDIVLNSDLLKAELALDGFIMAGGFGKRLLPLTESCPKPMLPVSGKPILQHLVERLKAAGIDRLSISTHYRAESIVEHFRDGRDFGVHIDYVDEDRPLGTAGALGKAIVSDNPLLVINGDIMTSLDFRSMLAFHREHSADMTIAVQQHEVQIPYGVVSTNGIDAVRIAEKPLVKHFVSAGIYLIQPDMCRMIPQDRAYDMPELITHLIESGKRVICFPIREYWLDVGQMEQYERASLDVVRGAC